MNSKPTNTRTFQNFQRSLSFVEIGETSDISPAGFHHFTVSDEVGRRQSRYTDFDKYSHRKQTSLLRLIKLHALSGQSSDSNAGQLSDDRSAHETFLTLYGPYILESAVHDGFAFIKKGGFP